MPAPLSTLTQAAADSSDTTALLAVAGVLLAFVVVSRAVSLVLDFVRRS